jgi:phosphomannomutase
MSLKFGTSGVRGLVTDMTDRECYLYTRAFVQHVKDAATAGPTLVAIAGDLRGSTPRIIEAVAHAVASEGLEVDRCGFVSTPAVMNYGIRRGEPSIMVTGSHIPDDRNGIKFNMPWGEVLKADEAEISRRYAGLKETGAGADDFTPDGSLRPGKTPGGAVNHTARDEYAVRFTNYFPAGCLSDTKVVFYQHSSVSRDVLPDILEALGAEVVRVGFSDGFVPVDTEAVQEPARLAAWVAEHEADALASTDGDADRPLLVDEKGRVVRGDVLGILVSAYLDAVSVATPVSCNTALEKSGRFENIIRTKIGSPYVVEAMNEASAGGRHPVVGYEANGGYLTASDIAHGETGAVLEALPTRDAALPIIAALLAAGPAGGLSALVDALPPRVTASGLLRGFPNAEGKALVAKFERAGKPLAEQVFSSTFGPVDSMDFTDGARITFESKDVVHFRPSGNAPEFRVYTESSTEARAVSNNEKALTIVEGLKSEAR